MNYPQLMKSLRTLSFGLMLMVLSNLALAAAGKVLFVSGTVSVERGATRALNQGDAIEVGDVIVTGDKSRAQLLMADGAKIALRAGTRFRIDEFAMPAAVNAPAQATVVNANGKSVASLLKGGFRTQTGTIGKTDRAAYEVRTPIGTLGIRGTDYTAVFCVGDCTDAPGLAPGQVIRDGLYLGVTEGAIGFQGGGRQINLNRGEFAFIPLSGSRPEPLQNPPAFLEEDGSGPLTIGSSGGAAGNRSAVAEVKASNAVVGEDFNERRSPTKDGGESRDDSTSKPTVDQPVIGTSPNGQPADLTQGTLPTQRQNLTSSIGVFGTQVVTPGVAVVSRELQTDLFTDATGSLTGFAALVPTAGQPAPGVFAIGTSASTNLGSHAGTGLRWGRWTTGAPSITVNGAAVPTDLSQQSLHWITGQPSQFDPVLPITGNATYTLVGATSPTDNAGNAGVMGAAFLSVDFTNNVIDTTLSLDINQLNWWATGTTVLDVGTNQFSDVFEAVLINGLRPGSGSFAGFFEQGSAADGTAPVGVGISYNLTDENGTFVNGVVALAQGAGQPPPPPVRARDVAFSVGSLGNSNGVDATASNNEQQLLIDVNDNPTQFIAPITRTGQNGTFAVGTSASTDTGFDAGTGIRWGRWSGGAATVTPPVGAPFTQPLTIQSLHWLTGPAYANAPAMPQTGTASYVLIGSTSPTNVTGDVGVLGAASFSADFTNRTIASALGISIDGRIWYASGTGTYAAGSNRFQGNYTDVQIGGLVRGTGTLSGFFVQPTFGGATTAGAGLTYNLADTQLQLGIVSGAAIFEQGNGTPLPPPANQRRDMAYVLVFGPQEVFENTGAEYTLDGDFNLTRFSGPFPGDPPADGTFNLAGSAIAESSVDAVTMLRWGRWSGGTATFIDGGSGAQQDIDLETQSLHWVESANAAAPPAIPTIGTVTYSLVGGTSPTDGQGNIGVLGSATLVANFGQQSVTSSLDLTIDGFNFVVSGFGVIGAQLGLEAHQFGGFYDTGNGTGNFTGFFSGPGGSLPGVPGGAGLNYSISDGQGVFNAIGVVVFRSP